MTELRPRRTVLYLPASNARAIEKARTLSADVLILDLEDAVAPDAKEEARKAAVAAVAAGGFGKSEVLIRANGLGTQWAEGDFAAISKAPVAGIVVPKVATAAEAAEAVQLAGGKSVWAMIETPRGVQNVDAIADTAGIGALVAGFADLAKELHAKPGPEQLALLYAASRIVMAARSSDILAFDGIYPDFHDGEGVAREARQAVELGFDGKTCIHPNQLEIVNRLFAPSEEEITYARGLIAAHEAAMAEGKGVASFKGRLVEGLHVAEAQRLLAFAEAI